MIPHICFVPQRLAIDPTPNLPRAQHGGPKAKHSQLAGNALEDYGVLFALRLELCVTSADELVYVEPQHIEHLIHRA